MLLLIHFVPVLHSDQGVLSLRGDPWHPQHRGSPELLQSLGLLQVLLDLPDPEVLADLEHLQHLGYL